MGKNERETLDFINVDSFSQLPFKRPTPPVTVREKNIRLFGIEFTEETQSSSSSATKPTDEDDKDNGNVEDVRKFECHYCCRSFPTSQALGGHQNAHKRERQHAKRAHLQQSAMVHNIIPDGHVYGLVNYRLGSTAMMRPTLSGYPSWTTNNSNNMWRIPAVQSNHSFNQQDRSLMLLPSSSSIVGDGSKLASMDGSGSQSAYTYHPKKNIQEHVSLDLRL